ncbi:hypothetical protein KR018_008637 [Drosophila ironensis]|nr:hypothetical protein KR018_008637 [Drosophila ironensis]
MCLPYLNKIFIGRRQHSRTAIQDGGITPRPSLANIGQVSVDTMRTNKSGGSRRNVRVAIKEASSAPSVNGSQLDGGTAHSSVSNAAATVANGTDPSGVEESETRSNGSGTTETGAGGGESSPGQRTSWWEYLGIKSKKPNLDTV